jgi:multidrug efflux pump
VPLALASGPGANSLRAIGTGVIGGILASTVIAVFFAPLFFWMLESVSTRFGGKKAAPAPAQGSALAPAQGGAAPAAAPHAKREGD